MTTTGTPAETIRRAAKLMRERAELATDGHWEQASEHPGNVIAVRMDPTGQFDDDQETVAADLPWSDDAEYIAGMHPGVALALADLLEREAALIDSQVFPQSDPAMERYPLAVARAYLGETAATTGETV
jgi:hypothetical protein